MRVLDCQIDFLKDFVCLFVLEQGRGAEGEGPADSELSVEPNAGLEFTPQDHHPEITA